MPDFLCVKVEFNGIYSYNVNGNIVGYYTQTKTQENLRFFYVIKAQL